MTPAMKWLNGRAPGFAKLSSDEKNAINDFSLLWGLFESRILSSNASAIAICETVESWRGSGRLPPDLFDAELGYFQQRYYQKNEFTPHFNGLKLRGPDRGPMVRAVLSGAESDFARRASTALIIVYRYRNNLFHGVKWDNELADQLDNFSAANTILIKSLERYGNL